MTKDYQKEKQPSASDKLAAFIGSGIARLQRRIATKLGDWEARCSTRQKKALLGLFFAVFGGYLLYLLVCTLFFPARSAAVISTPTMTIPQLSLPPPTATDIAKTTIQF